MRFGYVPPPFGALWPAIENLLDAAVKKGGNRWGDVVEWLEDGAAQLWLTMDPEPINATVTVQDGDTIEIWLCGGRVLDGSLHFLETILAVAKTGGATNARIVGRKGWARALKPYGWRVNGDELTKDFA